MREIKKSDWIKIFLLPGMVFLIIGCQSSNQTTVPFSITETSTLEIERDPTSTPTPSRTPVPSETPAPTETPIPSNTPLPSTETSVPTKTPNRLPEGIEAVSLQTEDGLELDGFIHQPTDPVDGTLAVVLAHEYYSSHHSWEWLADLLLEAGITSLTFDARGHGKSPGSKDVSTAEIDVLAAVNYLKNQGFEQIVCLGTSMGGSGCLVAAVEMELAGLAMLSSPVNIGGPRLITHRDIKNLTIPKVFMIAEEDRVGPDFVAEFIEMVDLAPEPKEYYLYPGDLHASELFYADFGDEVREILFNFVTNFSQSVQEQPAMMASSVTAADCTSTGLPETACAGVATNNEWAPIIREFGGNPMALVPAGCFKMGNDDGFAEMQPAHQICFDRPFWIDHTEVTIGQFADFLNGQGQPIDNYDKWLNVWGVTGEPHIQLYRDGEHWNPLPGDKNRPLENVTWFGAFDYCAWRNARLPSESEWEYAARGPDNLLYPWGNEFTRDNIVRFEGKNPEVGSKPQGASWVGALDMSGSVFEWTNSLYMPYPYNPSDGREVSFESDGGDRVFRGSAWYHPERMKDDLTATARLDAPPEYAAWYYGFRCVRSFNP